MSAPKIKPPDFDEEFIQAVAKWRDDHKIREDDATMLFIELFRIHQNHWDALRSREMPSFNQFRSDIALLTQTTKTFQLDTATLIELLKNQPLTRNAVKVTRTAAFFAALSCLLAGYLIRMFWP
jgi:hypothetical protein